MICRNCGTEIAERALICYRCGTATTEAKYKPAPLGSRRSSSGPLTGLLAAILAVVAIGAFAVDAEYAPVIGASAAVAAVALLVLRRRRR